MCAKDRSQNSVCSQTELVNSLFHLADVSSCPCLIRDSSGIIVHSNLLLTSKILEDINISKVFSLFSHSDLRSLNEEDVRVITYGGGKIVDGVTIGKYNCSILIEGFFVCDRVYTKWTFVNIKTLDFDFSDKLVSFKNSFLDLISSLAKENVNKWYVLHLHSFGFTHGQISNLIGRSEKTSRNYSLEIRRVLKVSNQDELILLQISSSLYHILISNISKPLARKGFSIIKGHFR